ncbi:MAG: exodeoxyribonuclease V subunit beta [Balneolia bacterium]|nr:exodeoxyribonuclease V subunit beta [Balneolia bacterium]
MNPFDIFESPVKGINLVESSAGTGKTYTISGLVVRLLAEHGELSPKSILVVTFTTAATQELRDRIARRIRDSAEVLRGDSEPGDDGFLIELKARFGNDEKARQRLERAMTEMDQASVFTIHGFCKQALQEYVVESNSSFGIEYMKDSEELLLEAADDVWRSWINRLGKGGEGERCQLDLLLSITNTPDELLSIAKSLNGKPYLEFAEEVPKTKYRSMLKQWNEAIRSLKETYDREEILSVMDPAILNQKSYKPKQVEAMLDDFESCFVMRHFAQPGKALKLASGAITTKGGALVPQHPFFDAMQAFTETDTGLIAEQVLIQMTSDFRQRYDELKDERRIRSFDDILTSTHHAVESNQEMRMKLRKQYPVALVDEFQDTDPIQLGIFKKLYFDADVKNGLFMIGDPKQSVYKFRGADINSYLSVAKNKKVSTFTLGKNYRSVKPMVDAVNALFQFVEPGREWPGGLAFQPSDAQRTEQELFIEGDDDGVVPMHFLMPEVEEPVNKDEASKEINKATAAEIARLLNKSANGEAFILEKKEKRPVRQGDVAILVSSRFEAENVRKELLRKNIKSVFKSSNSVFDTDQARLISSLIQIIKDSPNPSLIRMFLFNRVMGYRLSDLRRLEEDAGLNTALTESLIELRMTLERYGFSAMLRKFLNSTLALDEGRPVHVTEKIMQFSDGERVYTNLMHLNELIDAYEREHRPGMEELHKWLNLKIQKAESEENDEIRLESDDDLVQIVTMHSSKGLEYPIVFCNSLWSHGVKNNTLKNPLIYHDPDDGKTKVDLTGYSKASVQGRVIEETVAENIRLMYVALTRARYRCYISVGAYEDKAAGTSPLHFVMNGADQTLKNQKISDFEAYLNRIRRFAHEHAELAVCRTVSDNEELKLEADSVTITPQARKLEQTLKADPDWYVTSYSGIKKRAEAEKVEIEEDSSISEKINHNPDAGGSESSSSADPVKELDYCNLFHFPKGAGAGTFMHRLYEDLDFTRFETDARSMVAQYLEEDGYEENWTDTITSMLERSLRKKLPGSGAALITKGQTQTVDEMEFYFPLSKAGAAEIEQIIDGKRPDSFMENRNGFMTGFIDLLFEHEGKFYILDYKSDHLGDKPESYEPEALKAVMHERGYVFQYHIYLVALMRFLKLKLGDEFRYENHIGGAYYLFLRGIQPGDDNAGGIYFDNPSKEIIEELDSYFKGEEHAAEPV